jgi:Xaa-Pro aminopeptidase
MTNPSEVARPTPYFQTDFSAGEFISRRTNVMKAMGNAIAVLQGSPATGAFDLFRQNNEFYYLCGVEVPVAYLLIDGGRKRVTLYLPKRDPRQEESEGAQLSAEDSDLARKLTGVDDARPLDALRADIASARRIYLQQSPVEGKQACRDTLLDARKINALDPFGSAAPQAWLEQQIRVAAPAAEIRDLSPILDRLRTIKSPAELALMRRAGRLSALAVAEGMRCTKPGVMEYQLAAAAEYIYLLNGARGGGYRPIIASGENIWNSHYYRNNCAVQDGELVLMDYAPDYGNYTSDIGRMWAVNGTYSKVERELYGFVVEYHKILLRLIRPGLTSEQVIAAAAAAAEPLVKSWQWSKPLYEQAAWRLLQFQGSLSHGVGMAVHDAGNYKCGPLAPGMVFAVDPQLWIPEERRYIRVEDTVAVTETGIENLTSAAPLELDAVEHLMRTKGTSLLDCVPPDSGVRE